MNTSRILVIAGSDSGGGAGIQADIKTITMLGGHAMTAVTAITAQNTLGVQAVMPVPTEMVAEQIASVVEDIGVDAVKIGMLPSEECVQIVAGMLVSSKEIHARAPHSRRPSSVPIVLDPVLVATSGDTLADDSVAAAIVSRLVPLATLVTPNTHEARVLMEYADFANGSVPILLKGGDAPGSMVTDCLLEPDGQEHEWRSPRIATKATHGTGCTLASAIAVGLARGMSVVQAIGMARGFVRAALLAAPDLGQGHGPMGHQFVSEFRCQD